MLKFILVINVMFCSFVLVKGFNFCGDWTQYKGSKCFKILEKKDTEANALKECQKWDKNSTLITINSQKEQNFINKLLRKFINISMFAWIGFKYNGTEYKWTDSSDTEFTNWSNEAERSGEDPCVKMSLIDFEWTDSPCKKRALIVCQRRPQLSSKSLEDVLQNLSDDFQKQQDQINALIPLGSLYTQTPNQSSPQQLWPNMKWIEVTQHYTRISNMETTGDVNPLKIWKRME